MTEQIFYILDHDTEEKFCIIGINNFLAWLNDTDDKFSFSNVGYQAFYNNDSKEIENA
jgi:hypothetical protein